MKKLLFIILSLTIIITVGCGESRRKNAPSDSTSTDSITSKKCPPDSAMDQVQTIEVKYEGDCQYCSFSIENGKTILLTKGKANRFDAAIGGDEICTLFRVNTGRGLFRAFITINGKTQIVEQEISEMLEEVQRSFRFTDFELHHTQPNTSDPNTTP